MEALVRAHDWSRTALGPMSAWPRSLRGYVSMVLEMSSPAILFWGPDLVQVYNAGYAQIMGPRHPKYLGATYAECWPDTYPIIFPWMERVLRGETLEVERTLIPVTRYGFHEEAYFTFSFTPLRDDDGRVAGIFQPVVEVTGAVLSERRLETLRRLADHAHLAQMVGALAANREDIPFARLYLGETPAASAPEVPFTAALAPIVQRVVRDNEAVVVDRLDGLLEVPHRSLFGDETKTAVVLPIRRSPSEPARGALLLGVSPNLEFDDRYREFFEAIARQLAANLASDQESAARLDADRERQNLYDFFSHTPTPLCIMEGPEHRFVLANPAYASLVNADVHGKTVREVFPPDVVARFRTILDRVYTTGQPFAGRELPFRTVDAHGGVRELLINVSYTPIRRADGEVKGILAFVYDITAEVAARKRTESLALELREAVRARDEFVGIASHELKTPLTSLKLQIEMAARAIARGEAVPVAPDKLLATLLRQTNRLARLVEDMLDLSRIHAGKLVGRRTTSELSHLTGDVLDRFTPQLVDAGCDLRVQLAPGLVGMWDAFRIEQVITNLVTNALRYARGKPIEITTSRASGYGVLRVRDHGPGVAPVDRERIFARFERATNPSEVSGLGLGLFISRQIAEAHGGHVRLDESVSDGAAFVLELPLS